MAWCPNCKVEYVEGITTCDDCGETLVDKIEIEAVEPEEEADALAEIDTSKYDGNYPLIRSILETDKIESFVLSGTLNVYTEDYDKAVELLDGYFQAVPDFESLEEFEGVDPNEDPEEDEVETEEIEPVQTNQSAPGLNDFDIDSPGETQSQGLGIGVWFGIFILIGVVIFLIYNALK